MRFIFWAGLLPLLACGLLVLAFAADLGAAAVAYGPEYVWRLIALRDPSPYDDARFPARRIAASEYPVHFRVDPDGASTGSRCLRPHCANRGAVSRDLRAIFSLAHRRPACWCCATDSFCMKDTSTDTCATLCRGSFSMAKSVTSLLIGAAIAESKLPSIDTPAPGLVARCEGASSGSACAIC